MCLSAPDAPGSGSGGHIADAGKTWLSHGCLRRPLKPADQFCLVRPAFHIGAGFGWEAQLLLAWNPASKNEKPELFIGIRLPGGGQDADSKGAGTGGNRDSVNSGEGILGIENVWKLSIGNIELCYDREQEAFMLLMRDVALKIFDILKFPPTGAVQFDLFGPGEEAVIRECGWYALYRRDEEKKEDRMI